MARAALVSMAIVSTLHAQSDRAGEYRLKAAILYNLTKFVEWPAAAFSGHDAPFTICILGADPFGPTLDAALSGHTVGDRPLRAKRVTSATPGCHLLFISNSERQRQNALAAAWPETSVLTVGEGEAFGPQGGMIRLVTEGGRVGFLIDSAAAGRAHLVLSARLLSMAAHRAAGATP